MNVGGPALEVAALAEELSSEQFTHEVLAGEVDQREGDYLALHPQSVRVRVIPGLGRAVSPLDDVRAWIALIRAIRRFRPHIVHTHTAKAGLLGRTAAIMLRVPTTVHTFHGHLLHGYFGPVVTRLVILAERALASRTSALVAVGSKVRDELLDAGIGAPARFSVIPPGVRLPPAMAREAACRHLGLPSDVPIVAFVGRLTAVKRPDRMIEVARLVERAYPDVLFAVVGEGDLSTTLRDHATHVRSIRFLGWRSDVENVYAAARVVLLTSDNEGMPVSLIEAATCGRAVVATDVGSVREVVKDAHTGLLCPTDAAALAAAVCQLLGDDELRARMERNAAEASERFTRERLVGAHIQLYQRLVGQRAAT
jgi:glycosyltransferase involved in cell wall biosynthesis